MEHEDDSKLVELLRQGNEDAFTILHERYRKKLCVFIRRHTDDYVHAEDIAQKAFLKVFQSIESLRDGGKFKSWLYTIAYRIAVDDARKKHEIPIDDSLVEQKCNDSIQIDIAIANEERASIWSVAQNVLTPDEFAAIWLRYAEDEKVESIATIMKRSNSSVRVLLFRARKKLLVAIEN